MGQLIRVCVRSSIGLVVKVVEFPHRREASAQHLRERKGRDGLDAFGVEAIGERVHGFPPSPEGVFATSVLNPAAKPTLEGVAVGVHEAGQQDTLGQLEDIRPIVRSRVANLEDPPRSIG